MKQSRKSALGFLVASGILVGFSANCSSSSGPADSGFGTLDGGTDAHKDTGPTLRNDAHSLGDSTANGMDACASTQATAKQSPLDIYFLIDRSGSMAYNHAWTDEVQALNTFFSDVNSSGIGVGLGYMPQTDLCDVDAYKPDVTISALPGIGNKQQAALTTSLANNQPFGGTPTTIGLEGALNAVKANQVANPTHETVIVFSSDGIDINSCGVVPDGGGMTNTSANAISVVAAALALTPPVKTFVIGINPEPLLNAYAVAGGTGQAILIGTQSDAAVTDGSVPDAALPVDIEGPLVAAFNSVRATALPCTYSIPISTSGQINYGDVNVVYTPGGGTPQDFYYVSGESACQTNNPTWYYQYATADGGTSSDPTKVVLCPTACNTVKAATNAAVNIAYGCASIPPPK